MKKFILMLTLLVSCSVALVPSSSEARHSSSRRVSYHCRSCGDSVYQERYCRGHDRYRRPIYGWRTVSHRCRSHHGHGHHHGHHSGTHISGPGFHVDFGRR